MNLIERFLVRAKHWQLFICLVVLFVVLEVAFLGNRMVAASSPESSALLLTAALTELRALCFLLWLWSMPGRFFCCGFIASAFGFSAADQSTLRESADCRTGGWRHG
jgi:hypothetical protein